MTLLLPKAVRRILTVIVDAGIEHIRVDIRDQQNTVIRQSVLPNNDTVQNVFMRNGINRILEHSDVVHKDLYITGKLADVVHKALGTGHCIMPGAAFWQAARMLIRDKANKHYKALGIVELSASGYSIICVDRKGHLIDELLVTNPHCGAGSGINLSRVLQKLDIPRDKVDEILKAYLGNNGAEKRNQIAARADRCGVFSSSATVSDKNQGIPLDFALATTIKSEVLKACKKLGHTADKVYLTGGIFRWQYARDCARDYFKSDGHNPAIEYDEDQSLHVRGTRDLIETVGQEAFRRQQPSLRRVPNLEEYSAFSDLKKQFEARSLYRRLPGQEPAALSSSIEKLPVNMALDVGSTMAKIVLSRANDNTPLWLASFDNHGDTVETIKHIFRQLKDNGIERLNLQNIGITGSGRYQVQRVLSEVYPHLDGRVRVLVENYAHARGSIAEARQHINELKGNGIEINEEYAVLVDVGGEDTKISIISIENEDLVDNAMNIKCSAGTGSLMDTLKTLFGIDSIQEACKQAFQALKAYNINATCAVFLMENAGKMRAEGYPTDQILASCYWAIVENMARTLWSQVKIPTRPLILLHGQTMLSDPLPLAVTQRMQGLANGTAYGLVPDAPGHRACIGLLKSIPTDIETISEASVLDELIERVFEKKIITCRGAACGDKSSRCNRVKLTFHSQGQKPQHIQLGGCSAVNEMMGRKQKGKDRDRVTDTYKEIWNFIDSRLPRTDNAQRIIIPRSFAVSEQAGLLADILQHLGLPAHVDNIVAGDVSRGQRYFDLDACAPNIGATGQMMRLASEPHGMILVPQIDYLPTNGGSKGRTCTVNQGGSLIAMQFARQEFPQARLHSFGLDLKKLDARRITSQLFPAWQALFEYCGISPSETEFLAAVESALKQAQELSNDIADLVAGFLEQAIDQKRDIAIACGREYVLNPGVFDSHIGRLFRDKGVLAIPSYVFDIDLSEAYDHLYWRNPHQIVSIIEAVKNKKLHRVIRHKRLAALVQTIEKGQTSSLIGLSMVSTFSCGPDSISLPMIQEMIQSIPFILVQSDGAIQELAHLENRVNTFLKQLAAQSREELDDDEFSIELLDEFAFGKLDKDNDVIYFPTLGDNRVVTSVLRAAGFTCIDNYDDETYNLEQTIRFGRRFIGDAVCAPFAAVFGDTLEAIRDFSARKDNGQLADKHRMLIFNNKGTGPCRQGQYYEIHRLLLHRAKHKGQGLKKGIAGPIHDSSVKYMAALETEQYNFGIEEYTVIHSFQGIVIQGLLQAMYLKGGAACSNRIEFMQFTRDYHELKQTIFRKMEQTKPGRLARLAVKTANGIDRLTAGIARVIPGLSKGTGLAGPAKYFAYGLNTNNGMRKLFTAFSDRWIKPEQSGTGKIRIHMDGEAYMRIALLEDMFKSVAEAVGFNAFEVTSTPLWGYLEYVPEEAIDTLETDIRDLEMELQITSGRAQRRALKKQIRASRRDLKEYAKAVGILRDIIAGPLYKAAGIKMPHPVKKALEKARTLLPTGKPHGELLPYVGESLLKLEEGTDLILNIAPAGCMVSTMGGVMHPIIQHQSPNKQAHMQTILSQNGEIDAESVAFALLKKMGPIDYYTSTQVTAKSKGMPMLKDLVA